jgi:hypothetical protein
MKGVRPDRLTGQDCHPKLAKPLSTDPFPTVNHQSRMAPETGITGSGWNNVTPNTCRLVANSRTGVKGECRQGSLGRFVESVGHLGVSANLIEAPPWGWMAFPPKYSTRYVVNARA